ncbi:hypothetical protein ACQJBY_010277 [Aegilops geniculata]
MAFSSVFFNSIAPKKGDRGMAWAYNIDLMYYYRKDPARPVDMVDFLWHEIRMACCLKLRTLPHAPFIQTVIDSVYPCSIAKTSTHSMWIPRDESSRGKAPAPPCVESSLSHTNPFMKPPFAVWLALLGSPIKLSLTPALHRHSHCHR